jgi:hypothetical protein
VDGTDSGSFPMANFGISGVDPSGSATTVLDRSFGQYSPYRKKKQTSL